MKQLWAIAKHLPKMLANLDIRVKIIGLAVGSVLVLGAVATLYMYSFTSRMLGQELIHESHDVAEELSEELVIDIKTPLLIDDPQTVQILLNNCLKSDTMVRYAFITDMSGKVLFDTFNKDLPTGLSTANNISPGQRPNVQIIDTGGKRTWDAAFPVTIGQRTDVIRIGYGDEEKRSHLNNILAEQILVTAGMATLVLVVAFLLGSFLARQIKVLAQAASAVAKGEVGHQVKVFSRDALGQLAHSFNDMSSKLALMQGELAKREDIRRHLLNKIIKSQEEERVRVARELHDNLGQTLSTVGYGLESVSHLLDTDPVRAKSILESIHEENLHAQHELRTTIYALRPSVLDDLGLIPALRSYATTRVASEGITVDFITLGETRRLSPEIETALFRIGQEALNNVVLHASARNVHFRARFGTDAIEMDILDDGHGFDTRLFQNVPNGQYGVLGMRERAELVGGSLKIVSNPGQGCHVTVRIPLTEECDVWNK